ncbi:MAG: cobalamin-binding protein [Thermodesulfobacteriota bacterium]
MTPRIVSLLPSATEIVCALGLRDHLVGVSHECDFPPDVVGLPVVTASKVDVARRSEQIDADIRALVMSGLGVYTIDAERLAALAPDLIVTQDQCDVCAVPYAEVVAATRALVGSGTQIVSLRPSRLEDVWRDVETVATAAGIAAHGRGVADQLRGAVAELRERTGGLPRPRLACIEWLDPLMAAGNWLPDLADAAGASYQLAAAGTHSGRLEWQTLVDARPDVVCVMPCGFSLARTVTELETRLTEERWRMLPAVRAGRVYAVDGSAYFNRPGPRLVESARILAGICHPDELAGLLPPGAVVQLDAGSGGGATLPL